MLVIIPNPNDLLVLTDFQKKLLTSINEVQNLFRNFPLWIELPPQITLTPKEFSKQICSVIIKEPLNNATCPVEILLNDNKKINSSINLIKNSSGCETNYNFDLKKLNSQEVFPMSLKVFRIGIMNAASANSCSISDDCWIKLQK